MSEVNTSVVVEDFVWAVRLWAFDERLCHAVLVHLVDRHFLVRTKESAFARA